MATTKVPYGVSAVTEKLMPGVEGVKVTTPASTPATTVNDPNTTTTTTDQNKKKTWDESAYWAGVYGPKDNSGGGGSSPTWADAIQSNPDAMNQYLNPDAAAQSAELAKAMEGTPNDYLSGTEGHVPTTEDSLAGADAMLENAGIGGKDLFTGAGLSGDVAIDRIDHVNIDQEKALLDQITEAQRQQTILNNDRTVAKGTADLQRALEDAQDQYRTQRDQIAADEARAKDNQVLYSEARGDRGGIGQAQYDTIMNTAATNRYTVQKEQTKAAQDVQRQVADLRAQGEFQKADQLLSISQNYLGQLMNLYKWAQETNLGVDEFNTQIAQWEENYKMSLLNAEIDVSNMRLNMFNTLQNASINQLNSQIGLANATQNAQLNNLNAQLNMANAVGAFSNGTPTYQARLNAINQLAESGNALMQAGVAPTAEQLAAMGLTQDQAVAYLKKYFPGGPTTV